MALKAEKYVEVAMRAFCPIVADKGSVVFHTNKTSGGMNVIGLNGKIPYGILLQDVVNLDLSKQQLYWCKDEVQIGGVVDILIKGYVVIKFAKGTRGPIAHPVYVNPKTGKPTLIQWGPQIGRLLSRIGKDGFAKVEINI